MKKYLADYQKFLKKIGATKKRDGSPVNDFPNLKIDSSISTSDRIVGQCFKRDSMDYRWKKGREETRETIAEIQKKSQRIDISYNKGGLVYITDDDLPRRKK